MNEPNLPQLVMTHEDLTMLPSLTEMGLYQLSAFRPGDEQAWETIIGESFQTEFSFEEFMKKDAAYKPERILIVWKDGDPAATASAWHHPKLGNDTGYLHMVGARNAYAGQGLGQFVTHAALIHMQKEGRTKALLNTDDFRIPAIITYLRLGFVPVISHESHAARWSDIAEHLRDTGLRAIIEGSLPHEK
ncbi:GNAT family N-acetyltransferase [Paenibacillus chibensis]|uniref:GNAT family N-acetyltransferase n=1 Tax=Paenibacillus chibensis TaxID=59846 RepID=A0ABU6PUH7_9BACL|nr:GNAT family N-acetyltransferase [Paenibacillus chibensis]